MKGIHVSVPKSYLAEMCCHCHEIGCTGNIEDLIGYSEALAKQLDIVSERMFESNTLIGGHAEALRVLAGNAKQELGRVKLAKKGLRERLDVLGKGQPKNAKSAVAA